VLRYALRTLLRSRALTVTAVLTLGLAVGANTALFSLVNAILLRPLPGVADPGRLVNVHRTAADGTTFHSFSHPDYADLSERGGRFVRLAAFNGRGASLGTGGLPEVVGTQLVSGNYFDVLGVRPRLGRMLSEADDRIAGASPVAVVSHSLWQRRLGGDPSAIGRRIRLNGFPFTVVGVAPPGFQGHFVGFPFEVWVPLAMAAQAAPGEELASREANWLELVGRLEPGVSRPQAQAGLAAIMSGLARDHALALRGAGVDMRPMTGVDDSLRGGVVGFLAVLQTVAILVLLIAGVNLAGLLMARTAARARELAVRMALGASRGALMRQLTAETVGLFVLGGLAGVAVAFWTVDLLHAFQPAFPIPLRFDLRLDARVLAFAAVATILAGAVCGLVPALQSTREDILPALKDARVAGGPRLRLRRLLVAGQVALTTLLLVGAGLFLRTLQSARTIDPGFEADGVHSARLDLTLLAGTEASGRAFYDQLLARLAAEPGVRSASLAASLPLRSLAPPTAAVRADGPMSASAPGLTVAFNAVSPGFFDTLRIPLRAGRAFLPTDTPDKSPVVVVNEALAARLWPDRPPLGARLWVDAVPREVVGVVRGTKVRSLTEEPALQAYVPLAQSYQPRARALVLGEGDLAAALRRDVAALAQDLPVMEPAPLREAIAVALFPQRMAASVAGALGVLGLVLAATGLYGVVTYSVSLRTREMGVRVALGARRADVMALVVGGGLRLTLAGVAGGAALAAVLTRALRGLLAGVSPTDAPTFFCVALLMAAVAALASYLPARRAASVDPMTALRSE
jgi:putative ABC transport system permease protein